MVNAQDRHPEDLKATIRKRFGSLRALENKFGLAPNTVTAALRRPYEQVEQVIAGALEVKPAKLWPSRYHFDGSRRRPQPTANYDYARGRAK